MEGKRFIKAGFWLVLALAVLGSHGRTVGCPTTPAQIPACGITAPGSSVILASA